MSAVLKEKLTHLVLSCMELFQANVLCAEVDMVRQAVGFHLECPDQVGTRDRIDFRYLWLGAITSVSVFRQYSGGRFQYRFHSL